VEAVIRPCKLDAVKNALSALGIGGMTVSDVRGIGHQPEHRHQHAGMEYAIDLLPRAKVEVVVAADFVEPVVSTICKAAWTGSPGDGKVFVMPVAAAIRIRTGETGREGIVTVREHA
jgi:nitrogen regulatory protein P-II 1